MHIHKLRKKIKKKKDRKYLTKNYILKKLFLNEEQFRKLCIFKGIYPKDFKDIPLKYRRRFYRNKVYYTRNDFQKLSHEKIIADFRKIKIYLKKYKNYKTQLQDKEKCKKIIKNFPRYKLDHIIKERFPICSYAIEQLDDALNCIIAYSLLPSNEHLGIKNNLIISCTELKNHFHYYIYKTNKVKKAFISVKGYYIQAEILQKKITWLIPYIFTPYFDNSINFNIISNFTEYYVSLVKFVLFKLYKVDNIQYPPKEIELSKNEKLNHLAYDHLFSAYGNTAPLGDPYKGTAVNETEAKEMADSKVGAEDSIACTIARDKQISKHGKVKNGKENKIKKKKKKKKKDDKIDLAEATSSSSNLFTQNGDNDITKNFGLSQNCEDITGRGNGGADIDTTVEDVTHAQPKAECNKEYNVKLNHAIKHNANDEEDGLEELFRNHIFYIHSDMPLDVLSIIILSCGGMICWNNIFSPLKYESENITHEILELHNSKKIDEYNKLGRFLIQPQYIFDCLNKKKILPCSDYFVNKTLPVHLSPFIEDDNFKNLVKTEEYAINKILTQNEENNKEEQERILGKVDSANNNTDDEELLKSDDEITNITLQRCRTAALNSQFELENEDNNNNNDKMKITEDVDLSSINDSTKKEEIQRHKIALSKKKRKLYALIEREERKQKLTIENFMKRAKKKKNKRAKGCGGKGGLQK
ncbi:pescadillo-like protein [Plasmodium brasilianum]|uniref:Pescadillo homolog n=2 Tax=Plasmodium (Plasmodium) TaxID=418103 RepID=A0A1A8VX56_PLAMA|nr:pescadillo homolog, putative [Plasmodium malariae]KAI4838210.1 pescadillo-like protein [Plasmodium brasilianum]SBS85167.1 pescadillo homolog, putative (PES) [Plasmodium malariae]SCN12605.1 pescadillo homolog, putative [Plasmodium malariae]